MSHYLSILIILSLPILTKMANWIPLYWQRFLYSTSMSIKEWMMFFLPFVVFSLLLGLFVKLPKKAIRYILSAFLAIMCSNAIASLIGQSIGRIIYSWPLNLSFVHGKNSLDLLWSFSIPQPIKINTAIFLGTACGLLGMHFSEKNTQYLYNITHKMSTIILKSITICMPIFVLGTLVNLISMEIINDLINKYFFITSVFLVSAYCYLLILALISFGFHLDLTITWIKNLLPPTVVALTSMSSLTSLPLNLSSVNKNLGYTSRLAHSILPISTNIHTIGDCFFDTIFIFAIMKMFGIPLPGLWLSLLFTARMVLIKYSNVSIPGGGLLVLIPVLEEVLNFTPDMIGLASAIFILCDPLMTAINVSANNLFAVTIGRIERYYTKKQN